MPSAIYVSNADSGTISVLRLDENTAELSAVQELNLNGIVMPLAVSPDRRFLYAARRSAPFAALSMRIDADNGTLTLLGEVPLPHSMAFVATDRSGRWLLSASYGGNLIAVSPIDTEGRVLPAHQVLPTEPHAHAIQADPSNRFVFATSLGGGIVMQLRFDVLTGRLAPNAQPSVAPHTGASPRHFAFGADGRFAYLINELDASIDVLAFDAEAGTLHTRQTMASMPPGFAGVEPWAADLHLTADGRFLYSSERRSSTLAAFRIDAATGELSLIGRVPTQMQPRGFNITADGRFLIVAGQLAHKVGVHEIDPLSGALSPRGECAVGQNPNWVESVALPV